MLAFGRKSIERTIWGVRQAINGCVGSMTRKPGTTSINLMVFERP